MKIAYIGQKGVPAKFGGVETHVEELAKRMAKKGHKVFVYARNNYTPKDIKEYAGINIINLPTIPSKHLDAITHTFLASIHSLFQNFDIIHYHSIGPSIMSFIPRIFKRKAKIIGTYHCQDYYHKKWSTFAKLFLKAGEWMICHAPHKTIAVSKIIRDLAKEKFKKDLIFIPNGANTKRTENSDKLSNWNLEPQGYILSVSRLIKHKGIHYLIKAFVELEKKNLTKNKKLVITGDGFHTDDYVKTIKKLAQKSPDIIFTGNQTGEELKQLFSHACVFAQPSETEGLSIALLEALSYEKAVLTSDIPENLEAVEKAAISFRSTDSKDLEKKLLYLIENPQVIQDLSQKAKKISEEKYDWEKIAQATQDLYQKVINNKKKAYLELNYEQYIN